MREPFKNFQFTSKTTEYSRLVANSVYLNIVVLKWLSCFFEAIDASRNLVRNTQPPSVVLWWFIQWRFEGDMSSRHYNDIIIERDCVSNHQPCDCLLNRLFRHRSKKISKLRVTGFCVGNSRVTGEFPTQRASNTEICSIWWRHDGWGLQQWWQSSGVCFNMWDGIS